MKFSMREGATMLALLTGVSVAVAQTTPMGPATPPGAADIKSGAPLQLSAAQKKSIFQTVTKEKVKSPPPASFQPSVGAPVPASVELYMLPEDILAQVPEAKQYKYTVAQNQVVIVDPTNMK